ncbi:hypothetical protein [Pantoea phage Nafs113]|nr:hypothetical protein [Pantoea phage Nafs113]
MSDKEYHTGANAPSVAELITAEISDYFADTDAPGFKPDQAELTKRVLACLPLGEGWKKSPPITWQQAQDRANEDEIDAALREFVEDSTNDNGVRVVLNVMRSLNGEQ